MKITEKIKKALNDLLEHLEVKHGKKGAQAELSRQLAVSEATVSRYVTGKTKNIRDDVWEHFRNLLEPFTDINNDDAIFKDNKKHNAPDCPELCKGLSEEAKAALKIFAGLSGPDKLDIMTYIHRKQDEAQKKDMVKPIKGDPPAKSGRHAS